MRLNTEETKAILKNDMARQIIDYISPIYQNGPIALSIINAIGEQLNELDEWINQLWYEINPLTATWALKYWEYSYGLVPNSALSYENRRIRLFNKMFLRSRMNPYNIERLVKKICSREVAVEENTAYRKFDINIESGESVVDYVEIRKRVQEFKKSNLYFDLYFMVRSTVKIGWKVESIKYTFPLCGTELCGMLP